MGNSQVGGQCQHFTCSEQIPQTIKKNWMQDIPDILYLSEINIPGTHQSLSLFGSKIFCNANKQCQSWKIENQLLAGIRFFDIRMRVQNMKDESGICQLGNSDSNYDIQDLFTAFFQFLDKYSSETIIMRLRDEQMKNISDETYFKYAFENEIKKFQERPHIIQKKLKIEKWWYMKNKIPTLKRVRGKIVLLRDFQGEKGLQFQPSSIINFQQAELKSVEEIIEKSKEFDKQLKNLDNYDLCKKGQKFYINCINKKATLLKNPYQYALEMNRIVNGFKGFIGTILLDFPSEKLINYIVQSNMAKQQHMEQLKREQLKKKNSDQIEQIKNQSAQKNSELDQQYNQDGIQSLNQSICTVESSNTSQIQLNNHSFNSDTKDCNTNNSSENYSNKKNNNNNLNTYSIEDYEDEETVRKNSKATMNTKKQQQTNNITINLQEFNQIKKQLEQPLNLDTTEEDG